MISVGLFADNPKPLSTTSNRMGLFKGGGWYLFGIQCLAALCLLSWGILSTFILLYIINKIVPIRMDPNEELLGADLMEHRVHHTSVIELHQLFSNSSNIIEFTDWNIQSLISFSTDKG